MNDYLQQIEEAIRAISVHSPTSYSWFGQPSAHLSTKLRHALAPRDARNYLLYDLTFRLYRDFYCRGIATVGKREVGQSLQTGLTPFVAELSAANTGNGSWEEGWQVRAVADGTLEVCRGDLHMWAPLADCMPLVPESSIAPDATLRLHFPKELLSISPGFYMVLSDMPLSLKDGQMLVRVYWNLTAEGAVPFVRIATSLLNGAGLPFKLKVLRDPALFTRCDAAVVYVQKSDYPAVAEVLRRVYAEVSTHLKPGTPAFTKPLAWGVGVADDPGRGESFGQNRCRLVADALIRAYENGEKALDRRLHIVADRFAEDGISLTEPFLNPGSKDCYPLFPQPTPRAESVQEETKRCSDFGDVAFLKTADEIGWRLAREAVWHGDRCNWLGAEPIIEGHSGGRSGLSYRTLGPALYSGTSGVALFLAELYAATGTSEAHHTALGAMQQALCSADTLPLKSRLGLYTGGLGIAFAAARVGTLLGEAELRDRAAQLLHKCVHERQQEREFDLLSGDAGAIVACLLLREMLDDVSLLDLAAWLGDALLQNADASAAGSSWRSPGLSDRHNLTGFSHGTAGIGYALLELFHATGDVKYRAAAERAFAYERSWFNAEKGNWPDLRGEGKQRKRRQPPAAFATYWCHGAPGIGMARLRAYEMFNDATCKDEACVALHTTYTQLKAAPHAGNGNFSLCHGLTGSAEVLLYGRQVLGQAWTDTSMLALEVAEAGIDASKRQGGAWRCGVTSGETPDLLLGLAGIGYFYLRLHNPAIPSILLLQSENFRLEQSAAVSFLTGKALV